MLCEPYLTSCSFTENNIAHTIAHPIVRVHSYLFSALVPVDTARSCSALGYFFKAICCSRIQNVCKCYRPMTSHGYDASTCYYNFAGVVLQKHTRAMLGATSHSGQNHEKIIWCIDSDFHKENNPFITKVAAKLNDGEFKLPFFGMTVFSIYHLLDGISIIWIKNSRYSVFWSPTADSKIRFLIGSTTLDCIYTKILLQYYCNFWKNQRLYSNLETHTPPQEGHDD